MSPGSSVPLRDLLVGGLRLGDHLGELSGDAAHLVEHGVALVHDGGDVGLQRVDPLPRLLLDLRRLLLGAADPALGVDARAGDGALRLVPGVDEEVVRLRLGALDELVGLGRGARERRARLPLGAGDDVCGLGAGAARRVVGLLAGADRDLLGGLARALEDPGRLLAHAVEGMAYRGARRAPDLQLGDQPVDCST